MQNPDRWEQELIASGEGFSQETNEKLYTEYLKADNEEILQEVHKETHKLFQNSFQVTLSTNEISSDYSDKMEKYSDKLQGANDLAQMQNFIEDIIKDTNNMAASSRQLNQQLEETEKEVLLDALT
jgi:hypothetical protein